MGAPVIPLAVPYVSGREAEYVAEALAAGELAAGAFAGRFETAVAGFTGSRHAIATSSGTAALHVALVAAGIKSGDRVIVPATTFIATANAVLLADAEPVILDVERETWGMDPVNPALRIAGAVVSVHLYGHPCRPARGPAIEDAAEALGAEVDGHRVGSRGTAILSFNGNKLITTGGGGMVLTDSDTLAAQVRHLINQAKHPGDDLVYGPGGFNYRMPNVNAAIGLAQMESIEARLRSKRETAEHYQRELPNVFREQPWARSSYWLPAILVANAAATQAKLRAQGIETRQVWRPLHRQPGLSRFGPYPCPVADELYARGLTLPSSVGITPAERERVIEALWHA